MSWYAVEELENAWEETKEVLLPFDSGTWARLVVIVILTGHGFNSSGIPSPGGDADLLEDDFGESSSYDEIYGTALQPDLDAALENVPENLMTGDYLKFAPTDTPADGVLFAVLSTAVILVTALFLISSVFELIYYQSLLDKDVRIRKNFKKHLEGGARYFGFRIGVFVLTALVLAAVVGGFMVHTAVGIIGLLLVLFAALPVWIFLVLTHNFVLLKMIETGLGVLPSWKELWPDIKAEWKEVLVYLLVRIGLNIVFGITALIWALITFMILAIPVAILGVLLYLATPALAAIPLALGVIAWVILLLGAQVVFQTYLYNYAILVYHDLTT